MAEKGHGVGINGITIDYEETKQPTDCNSSTAGNFQRDSVESSPLFCRWDAVLLLQIIFRQTESQKQQREGFLGVPWSGECSEVDRDYDRRREELV